MSLSRRTKIIASSIFVITLVGFGFAFLASNLLFSPPMNTNSIYLQLLDNAGVMIEAEGVRIYIDPINLPQNFQFAPADAVLITHPHSDHYEAATINMLQKEGTHNVFPASMSTEIIQHSGIGVVPGEQFRVGPINVTAFYMYLPPAISSHPENANWTSYIIDINGFTIFHAGDAYAIEEYDELNGLIDVVMLPYYLTYVGDDIVEAVQIIQPEYLILYHFNLDMNDYFVETYGSEITECAIINLNYFESYTFITV